MLECPLIANNSLNLLTLKSVDIKEEHEYAREFVGIFADTESSASIDKKRRIPRYD